MNKSKAETMESSQLTAPEGALEAPYGGWKHALRRAAQPGGGYHGPAPTITATTSAASWAPLIVVPTG